MDWPNHIDKVLLDEYNAEWSYIGISSPLDNITYYWIHRSMLSSSTIE